MLYCFDSLFHSSGPPVRRPPGAPLSLEALESREVPATLTAAAVTPAQAGQVQAATFQQLFLEQTAHNDLLGFQAAVIAAEHASTAEVRVFAEHAAAADANSFGRLVPFFSQAGVPPPTLTAQDQLALRQLAGRPGRSLDLQFLQTSINLGVQNAVLFSAASEPGMVTLSGLAPFVTANLPRVTQRLTATAMFFNAVVSPNPMTASQVLPSAVDSIDLPDITVTGDGSGTLDGLPPNLATTSPTTALVPTSTLLPG